MKSKTGKNQKYEKPEIIHLGEILRGKGVFCLGGSSATDGCAAGHMSTWGCGAGSAASPGCTAGMAAEI